LTGRIPAHDLYTEFMRVPLFPLRTVLYPGGPLPLRIFEPRYLDMVSKCIATDSPFGVLLIKSGTETGRATTYDIGTLARIIDWYQGSDGLLGITAIGQERFRLKSSKREPDGLAVGEIEIFPMESSLTLPEEYRPLADILSGVLDDLGRLYETLEKNTMTQAGSGIASPKSCRSPRNKSKAVSKPTIRCGAWK